MAQQALLMQSVPASVAQQAESYQLGLPVAFYKPLFSNPLVILAIVVGGILADILLAFVVYSIGYIVYITFIIPFILLYYGIQWFIHMNLKVYQYTNGLVRVHGNRVDVVRWDQVEAVWQRIVRSRYSTSYTYTVRRMDGTMLKFNGVLRNVAVLGQVIQQEVTKYHMPNVMLAYNAGQSINFGKLSLSVAGLNNGKEQLPWVQVENVELRRGYLNVKKAGKSFNWAHIAAADIPNLQVLLNMVNYARSGAR